mgnify:CR=1 FL=1
MSNRELPAILLLVLWIGVVPLVRAGESNPRPVSKPPPVIADRPEDEQLAAVIEQVEAHEELYRNLEARIRTQYNIGDRQPIESEIVRTDFITVFVSQHEMFRVDTQGATFLVDRRNSWRNVAQLFDGETLRLAQRKGSDAQESAAREEEVIRPHTLQVLLDTHRESGAAATLATAVIPDATGYGRIQRDAHGRFARIVEQKDATPEQLAIREINPSYYCFRTKDLFDALKRVTNQNASGEYYITDVFELLLKDGKRVSVVDAVPPEDVLSVNTPEQLAEVDAILRRRLGSAAPARSHA